MALSPVTVVDNFTRSVGPGSWGNTDTGHVWLGDNGSYCSTDGNNGVISVTGGANSRGSLYIDVQPPQGNAQVVAKIRISSSSTVPNTEYGVILRRTGSSNFYALTYNVNTATLSLVVYANPTRVVLASTIVAYQPNVNFWFRFDYGTVGTGLRGKFWREGTTEPTSWQITSQSYDGAGAPGAGHPGIFWRSLQDSYNINVDSFYYYTVDPDLEAPMPVSDEFAWLTDDGWGRSNSGHIWNGDFADDPAAHLILSSRRAKEATGSDYYGRFTLNAIQRNVGWLGPSVSGNIEATIAFTMNNTDGNNWTRVGIRGSPTQTGGRSYMTGYAAEIAAGGNVLKIVKRTTYNADATVIATSGTFTPIGSGIYIIRFKIEGTTLSAKIWYHLDPEPGTWNVTVADSQISSGCFWLEFEQSVTTTHEMVVHWLTYQTPAPPLTTHTTTGNLSLSSRTDTTIFADAFYTNDSNNNNTINVRYKKSDTTLWYTLVGGKTRGSGFWQWGLSNLLPNTPYDFEVTFIDSDTVVGTNPRYITLSTTNNSVTTGTTNVNSIDASSAIIWSTYTRDDNNNSSATIDYRSLFQRTYYFTDAFVDQNTVLLQNHVPDYGTSWIKHPSGAADAAIYSNRLYVNSITANQKCIYYVGDASANNYYEVKAELYIGALSSTGHAGVCARMDTSVETYYVAMYDMADRAWELQRFISGTASVLGQVFQDVIVGQSYEIKLVVNDTYKQMFVDGVLVIQSTNNDITSAGRVGVHYRGMSGITNPTTSMVLDNFEAAYTNPTSTWTNAGAMTADRVNKRFTKNLVSLSTDTVYEFRTNYSDAEGTYGTNPLTTTGMTVGNVVELDTIVSTTTQRGATIDVSYSSDTNNNSTLAAQYRSTRDSVWTTVQTEAIKVDRTNKIFTIVLGGLRPSTTYQVQVTITDPDGYVEGSARTKTALFTTIIPVIAEERETKHYLWKIYEPDGDYITTWHDAGEPEFAWHENGGVTDLRVKLPRKLAEINNPRNGIAQQNRVDIMCLDPSSKGFGPNLLQDDEFDLGSWTLGINAQIVSNGGPEGSNALLINETLTNEYSTLSEPIILRGSLPLVIQAMAKASGARVQMYVEAYNASDVNIDQSSNTAETVGTEWQRLLLEYTPPADVSYVRVAFRNKGKTVTYIDKVSVRVKEDLIYRGRIETYTPTLEQEEEFIDVEVLGLVSQLSDDYIPFLQFVTVQPQRDALAGRPNYGPKDPSEMLKIVIDQARAQNSRFDLYYTATSIRATETLMEYTFRDQQVRACFDKIRALCPAGWHYYIEPDGLVVLRGPEHAPTHKLRVGVEILNFSVENSIRNLKNYVRIKGRQDEDGSEADGFGTIEHVAFDQASINKYGKRMIIIRDANITDPSTAELIAEGRLDEYNREEKRALCNIPDDKSLVYTSGSLRGDNIEKFRPGDNVHITNPLAGPQNTYWDGFVWDDGHWDFTNEFAPLPETAPIKTVQFHSTYALLEISERVPSQESEYGRLYRWLQLNDSDKGDDA